MDINNNCFCFLSNLISFLSNWNSLSSLEEDALPLSFEDRSAFFWGVDGATGMTCCVVCNIFAWITSKEPNLSIVNFSHYLILYSLMRENDTSGR